jgi:hypothetical protein
MLSVASPALRRFDFTLRAWLGLGLLAMLLLPAARGHAHWIGWLPYWLVGWPALALALLHRGRWSLPRLQRLPRPRRRRGAQARRQPLPLRRALLAALRGS